MRCIEKGVDNGIEKKKSPITYIVKRCNGDFNIFENYSQIKLRYLVPRGVGTRYYLSFWSIFYRYFYFFTDITEIIPCVNR